MNQQNDVIEIDLLEVLHLLKKKALLIILVSILFAGAAGAYAYFLATPIFESTSKIYIKTQSTSITSLADIQVGSSLAYDYQEMIVSRRFLNELKADLGLDYTYKQIKNMITVENPSNTRILNISVKSADADQAKSMANSLAMISKKNISEIMQTDEPTFYEKAIKASVPVEPQKNKLILIGFLLGFLISACVIIASNLLNDKFTSTDDIERVLGLPVLASIPLEGNETNKKKEIKVSSHNKKAKK